MVMVLGLLAITIAVSYATLRGQGTATQLARNNSRSLEARAGWTGLVIEPDTEIRAVDGMITGWHEPEASHLQMLTAIAGEDLLERSYDEALRCGYLWHEFGDSHLILP